MNWFLLPQFLQQSSLISKIKTGVQPEALVTTNSQKKTGNKSCLHFYDENKDNLCLTCKFKVKVGMIEDDD
jgi:hypothetical protein